MLTNEQDMARDVLATIPRNPARQPTAPPISLASVLETVRALETAGFDAMAVFQAILEQLKAEGNKPT